MTAATFQPYTTLEDNSSRKVNMHYRSFILTTLICFPITLIAIIFYKFMLFWLYGSTQRSFVYLWDDFIRLLFFYVIILVMVTYQYKKNSSKMPLIYYDDNNCCTCLPPISPLQNEDSNGCSCSTTVLPQKNAESNVETDQ